MHSVIPIMLHAGASTTLTNWSNWARIPKHTPTPTAPTLILTQVTVTVVVVVVVRICSMIC